VIALDHRVDDRAMPAAVPTTLAGPILSRAGAASGEAEAAALHR
jgi:hypothetical protein